MHNAEKWLTHLKKSGGVHSVWAFLNIVHEKVQMLIKKLWKNPETRIYKKKLEQL